MSRFDPYARIDALLARVEAPRQRAEALRQRAESFDYAGYLAAFDELVAPFLAEHPGAEAEWIELYERAIAALPERGAG